ncbi:centromere kinetochore component CENP-T-domain-containing protein [Bipolaris maydis]|uniref:centromere kinetochore component CENP-T-domain-containing protein n=1 Tax=Cochliobolus heterostrophus TaxID=5016 RepID=UPI0024D6D538|nr:centromere kinetochore component CENP-T-domain-containing protein [Bipolaris maydis]KAJ6280743.1 centromere kinetochore component CENP-T-domain-containing protein [Bipolaris maydis]
MAESARKKHRFSPDAQAQGTPSNNATLQPITPFRRAISVGPTPGSRRTPLIRTPGTGRTPRGGPATRPLTSRRIAPTTPHAIRALRERANAARTPGNNRRRSGRIQRETPRDLLRDLSRALARTSRPVEPSPQVLPQRPRHSALDLPDVEDGPPMAAPRLSMPLENMYDDDDDDESFHSAPPRQSLLPDLPDDVDGGTVQSLEFGRRAISEDPRLMYGGRQSERFGDLSELGAVEEEYEVDGTFINRRADGLFDQNIEQDLDGDDTTIQALTGRRDGRTSDANLGIFGDGDDDTEEPTFRFMIPDRMRAPPRQAPQEEQEAQEDNVPDSEPVNLPDETQSDLPVDDDAELAAYREEESAIDRSLQTHSPERPSAEQLKGVRKAKEYMVSEHGIGFPSFPAAPVKKLALGFIKSQGSKAHLSKDTLDALVHTTNDFFEQISIDLAAYAQHGGRRMIEESDVIALMKRTRKTTESSTSFSLAQKMLPRELVQQLRMQPPVKLKSQKRKRPEPMQEDDEEEEG